jgi:RimJ/RimL family protein N-acetyltransferase
MASLIPRAAGAATPSARTPNAVPPPSPRPEHFPHLLPELTDGRLLLRAWRPADGAALTSMARERECQRWCIGLPRPYSLSDAQHYISTSRGAWELWGMARFAVVDAEDGALLASVAIKPIDADGGEIGYMAAAGARRRGVTAGALRLLAGWAFGELRMQRLEALIQADNEASIRTAERAGFVTHLDRRACCSITGERREHVVYELVAPLPSRQP